ncbi:hypothetical protein H0H92_012192 [Tricholoma furcatifolium]|nr:hypothetical protein H0H92_012192 [Tricholoma furcatifolium]
MVWAVALNAPMRGYKLSVVPKSQRTRDFSSTMSISISIITPGFRQVLSILRRAPHWLPYEPQAVTS